MNGTSSPSSGSTARRPVNGGAAGRRTRRATRFARAASSGSSGFCFSRVLLAQALLQLAVLAVEPRAPRRVEQDETTSVTRARVEHVHGLVRVRGRDPHRRVLPRRRRAADQQRQLEPAPLHLLATSTIWSSDGVISPERPTTSRLLGDAVSRIRSAGTITPRSITS